MIKWNWDQVHVITQADGWGALALSDQVIMIIAKIHTLNFLKLFQWYILLYYSQLQNNKFFFLLCRFFPWYFHACAHQKCHKVVVSLFPKSPNCISYRIENNWWMGVVGITPCLIHYKGGNAIFGLIKIFDFDIFVRDCWVSLLVSLKKINAKVERVCR